MTIASTAKITLNDYNNIYSLINDLLGQTPNGYGQAVNSTPATATTKISATQYSNMYADMVRIANHQGTINDGPIADLVNNQRSMGGSTIYAFDFSRLKTAIEYLSDPVRRYVSAESSNETLNSSQRYAIWGSQDIPQIGHEFTLTFGGTNSLRYFFNAGGNIVFQGNMVGPENAQAVSWNNLLIDLSSSGAYLSANTFNASTGTRGNVGALDLTTDWVTLYTLSPSSAYVNNDYTIRAKRNAASSAIDFQVLFNDDSKNQTDFTWGLYDVVRVSGYISSYITCDRPTGSHVTLPFPAISVTREMSANRYTDKSGYVNNLEITYPLTARSPSVGGYPFVWSISGGKPGETWYATTTGPTHARIPASGTFSLNGSGAAYYNNGDFGADTGLITVTWYFALSGVVTKTINVLP
jgi:hypothetical protein